MSKVWIHTPTSIFKRKEPGSVQGFTLVELLVVISIIGLLSSVVLASLVSVRAKARFANAETKILEIKKAIQLYAADHNGEYPLYNTPEYSSNGNDFSSLEMNFGEPDYPSDTNSESFIRLIKDYLTPKYLSTTTTFSLSDFITSPKSADYTHIVYFTGKDASALYSLWAADSSILLENQGLFCGGQKINKYLIEIYSHYYYSYFHNLHLPTLTYVSPFNNLPTNYNNPTDGYVYCVGE